VPVDEVTYFHVELRRHDLLVADGLLTESYLDTGNRADLANGGDVVRLHPDFSTISSEAIAIWEARGYAPLVVTGPELAAARQTLEERARRMAQPQPPMRGKTLSVNSRNERPLSGAAIR
jgi:hypothetical protein